MNLIENVWVEMLRGMDFQHGKEADLWNSVTTIWNNISNRPNYWQILSKSMTNRLQVVVDVQGDWTKY
jgi:hypothetical protein